jgi:hypothetical protein
MYRYFDVTRNLFFIVKFRRSWELSEARKAHRPPPTVHATPCFPSCSCPCESDRGTRPLQDGTRTRNNDAMRHWTPSPRRVKKRTGTSAKCSVSQHLPPPGVPTPKLSKSQQFVSAPPFHSQTLNSSFPPRTHARA